MSRVGLMKGNREPDISFVKEDQSMSVENQDNEVAKAKKIKKRKLKLKKNESGGDVKRRRNTLEEEQAENMEKLEHASVSNLDERKLVETTSENSDDVELGIEDADDGEHLIKAVSNLDERKLVETTTSENNDDVKLGIEDGDEFQGSVNKSASSNLKKKRKVNDTDMVHGKRFTKDEDDIIRKAVLDYVDKHELGEVGVDMVMSSRKHSVLRGCWKEIAECLPYRPRRSVRERAQNIFQRGNHCWSKEEIDYIKEMYRKRGADWAYMAKQLGRHRIQVCDTFRRTKSPNLKKGLWSQDEYQGLFDLVHSDLEDKAFVEEETQYSKHPMVRDNISWTAISDKLGTRYEFQCCGKWYNCLSSEMVGDGIWGDSDDYRMLIALYKLDSSCEEEVEWDSLMEHRTGELCRKRWKQMIRHIGEHGSKSFGEQVEVLSQRYCSKMLNVREKLDSRRSRD